MGKNFNASPQFWRIAAREARRQTDDAIDPQERSVLLRIADGYDWLAEHAAERLRAGFDELRPHR